MKRAIIKGMIRRIYAVISESGVTSHKYYDETYKQVRELQNVASASARVYANRGGYDMRPCVIIENVDECETCKRYHCSIEDSETGERYGGGCIVASFCGTIENPRAAYDLCATWWAE